MSTEETKPDTNGTSKASNAREKHTPDPNLKAKLPGGGLKPLELEGSETSFATVLGTEIGIGQKDAPASHAIPDKFDPYQWFERTSLTPEEIKVFVDMKQLAEHGIGGDALDIPIPEIAEMIVDDLRARRSRTDDAEGQSSKRFNEEMTTWVARLKAQEDERQKQNAKGIGA